jgi:flagellar hook-associated protein 3 FlgL
MLSNNTLRHMSNSYQSLEKIQNQLSTGKKISRASQDPVVAMNGMRYRTQVTEIEQFKRNLAETYNWMDTADSTLDKVSQTLHRLKELTVQASNDTYEGTQRESIRKEITQLREHIIALGNTKSNNKYIFNGTDTINPPIDEAQMKAALNEGLSTGTIPDIAGAVSSNSEDVQFELLKGVNVVVNSNATSVFSEQFFRDIMQLEVTLNNPGATSEDISAFINSIDKHLDNVVNERAELGARVNRVEMVESRVYELEVIAKRTLSNNEDVDMERAIIDLMSQESVHRAALSASARIIQPSLMDFLR